jgi:hypothetical protein
MKYIVSAIFMILPFSVFGQKITCSPEISNAKDGQLIEVRDFWISYINSTKRIDILPSNKFWNKNEIDIGYGDIVLKAIQTPYQFGNLKIGSIEKTGTSLFKIYNVLSLGDSIMKYKFAIYVKKDSEGYRLINYFTIIKPRLQNFEYCNFDFYYPKDQPFDSIKAIHSVEFYSKILKLYEINPKHKVTYILGSNLDNVLRLLGIEESILNVSSPLAGSTINTQNFIILSGREDHIHEITHAVFIPEFPNGHMLFEEGIATYYGGAVSRNLTDVIRELNAVIKENPNVDLSNIEDIDKILNDGKVNNFYFIGAIFIDYALKLDGPQKVIDLLKFPVNNPYTFEDARNAIEQVLGIKKTKLDSFLKKYIRSYNIEQEP